MYLRESLFKSKITSGQKLCSRYIARVYLRNALFHHLRASAHDAAKSSGIPGLSHWPHSSHSGNRPFSWSDLSSSVFKEYLIQDYIFLQRFIKILALSAYKAKSTEDMNRSVDFIIAIKNELKLHIHYCKKFGISKNKILTEGIQNLDQKDIFNAKNLGYKIKLLANHGQEKKYVHKIVGFNSRLDSLQAAILRFKLSMLNQMNQNRQNAA